MITLLIAFGNHSCILTSSTYPLGFLGESNGHA
jgi:hypothetical protein